MSEFYREAGQVIYRHERGLEIVGVRLGNRVIDIGPRDESTDAIASMLSRAPWMEEALDACLVHPTTIRSKKLRVKLERALGHTRIKTGRRVTV